MQPFVLAIVGRPMWVNRPVQPPCRAAVLVDDQPGLRDRRFGDA